MIINVPNAGSIGLNRDLSVHEMPINAFTDSSNVRFLDGYAGQFLGHSEVYNSPTITPYHVTPVIIAGVRYWIYAGLNKIFAVARIGGVTTHTDLTRTVGGDYSALPNQWTSAVLGGIPVFNAGNTTDVPQRWDLNLSNNFTALDAWPANTYCKAMRSYKNYLVALSITKPGGTFPFMVKWSNPADPGSVPSSWDETDPTNDAGEVDLAEGYDVIVDGLQLRDSFMIYKEQSVWRMDFTGGQFVFRFSKVLGVSGAMNRNCIVEIDGYHLVLTNNDIVVHDGVQANSILDKQTRRWLFQNIDVESFDKSFVFKNPFYNEVFICFALVGSAVPNHAIVYNYKDKTVSDRSVPNIHCGSYGAIDEGLNGNWEQDPDPWETDTTTWNSPDVVPSLARALMGSEDKLYLLDSSLSFDGALPASFIERRGLGFGKDENVKLIRGIRPRITGPAGSQVLVKVGSQNDPYEDPVYTTMTHTIGTTVRNDCLVSGRYIAIRFENLDAYSWRLDSYDVELEESGRW